MHTNMSKEQFISKLKELGFDKTEFSDLSGVPYTTVNNWGVMKNGKPLPVPIWVEPFLSYYEKAKKLEYVMSEICQKIESVKK